MRLINNLNYFRKMDFALSSKTHLQYPNLFSFLNKSTKYS